MSIHGKMVIASLTGAALLLAGCADSNEQTANPSETLKDAWNGTAQPSSPQTRWVDVFPGDSLTKHCDGEVMIYRDTSEYEDSPSIAVVYPHPECPPD